jgi:hypothetical protein
MAKRVNRSEVDTRLTRQGPTAQNEPLSSRCKTLNHLCQKTVKMVSGNIDIITGKIQNFPRDWVNTSTQGIPEREIGLDNKGKVMMIMPWKENHGFWTDSSVQVDELAKSRDMTFGNKEEFERLWDEFDAKN